ncbi:rCG35931 [Rattus norvegicus]|uniref:RCG35931 n=1 Tax=Rattus norvegicus TaxID=10116 RepID=A6IKJ9_RAT|nr:rCG35931 [Rattus norvegicus]
MPSFLLSFFFLFQT